MFRGFVFKLAPTAEQEQKFREFAGACRFVYNLALEQRSREWTYYRDSGVALTFAEQCRQLTDLRAEVAWLADAPRDALEAALRDLDAAYSNFFRGIARYPRPRSKGIDDSFRFKGKYAGTRRLNAKWSAIHLPKIGWVKYRDSRPLDGRVATVTITNSAQGWHVAFSCEAVTAEQPRRDLPAVGIDRGVANTLALSTGEFFRVTDTTALDRRCRRLQRIASRRIRGSRREALARKRVASLQAKRARIRRDWLHKVTDAIAARFDLVVMESLKIANLTASGVGKRGLNRSILEQGWGTFARLLTYKVEERGGTVVLVDPAYTSQQCSSCGTIDARSRESQARFACQHCGFEAHADTNAAVNILRRNTASMDVEGSHWRPREASTGSGLAPAENQTLAA